MSKTGPAFSASLLRYSGESFVSSGLFWVPGEPGGAGGFRAGDVRFGHAVVLVDRGSNSLPSASNEFTPWR